MRKRQRGTRPVSDEPLSAGRVEYLEQARERVRNRRIRRTALIVVALTLVVLFTTGIVGSSVAMAKDWADTARILLFPGMGWPQQTGVMEVKQLASMNSSFVELGEEGCVVWSRTGTRLNSIQSGYARPALAAGKNRFVLYNRSGNELRVESRTQNLYTKTMENSITLCAMADNGTLAVVTEDPGSAARLRVYSSSMEQLLSWSLTIADGTPLRLAFSPDGRRLAVAAVTVNGGQMVTNVLLLSQKIFYFHMPVAITSFAALAFAGYYAVRFLMTKNRRFDTCSKIAMEVALLFVACTMITGDLWTRFEWGVWWTWDPRLTTYLILMLIIIAYFILRNAIDEPERRATYGAVLAIIALIDVPICFMVTRLIPSSIHPVVVREGGMSGDMGITLMFCLAGIAMVGFALYRLRFRQVRLTERVEALKEQLED